MNGYISRQDSPAQTTNCHINRHKQVYFLVLKLIIYTILFLVVEARWGTVDFAGLYRDVTRPHGMGLWKKIDMEKQKFQECINWKSGKGDKNRFWMDEWIGRVRLKDQFPRVFINAKSKNMVIEEAYIEGSGNREWNVNTTRSLNDWEIDEYEALLHLLPNVKVCDNRDQIV